MKTKNALIIVTAAVGLFLAAGCGSGDDAPKLVMKDNSKTLQAQLDAKSAEFMETAPPELIETFNEGVKQVTESGVIQTALKKGDSAPDFTLPNAEGENVRLMDLLADGPVILTWYRGGWCPYCNIQLNEYNRRLDDFKKFGAQLVGVSPEIPDSSLSTKEKSLLHFQVLSDVGNQVARKYGIVYTLPDVVAEVFKGRLDLAAYNHDNSNELPLAVTYVIDTDRTIRYAFINGDYKQRAEPDDIIEALKTMGNSY
ncbi:MAG: peroxiredoxin-like family protein [Candidatus Zixiibacteriota bacterium]